MPGRDLKALIVAVNASYTHSCLAAWTLKAAVEAPAPLGCGAGVTAAVMETNLNEPFGVAALRMSEYGADVVCFPCYIWNVGYVCRLADHAKARGAVTVFGGPEVSYGAAAFLESHPYADFVVTGEGERPLPRLLEHVRGLSRRLGSPYASDSPIGVPSLTYRLTHGAGAREAADGWAAHMAAAGGRPPFAIVANGPQAPMALDGLPSPYAAGMLGSLRGKTAYVESSRGCPYRCAYCLPSYGRGVRYLSLDRLFRDLSLIGPSEAASVKFVDRTFNSDPERAEAIIKWLIDRRYPKPVQLEVNLSTLGDGALSLIDGSRPGAFRIEAGIQSFDPAVLGRVGRSQDPDRLVRAARILMRGRKAHLHLDLIVGLPGETPSSFAASFDRAYGLRPHTLQIGFLKALRGTPLKPGEGGSEPMGGAGTEPAAGEGTVCAEGPGAGAPSSGLIFAAYPPYEVIWTSDMDASEMDALKRLEMAFSRTYNSGRFRHTLRFLDALRRRARVTAHGFYAILAHFLRRAGALYADVSAAALFGLMADFITMEGASFGLSSDKAKMRALGFLAMDLAVSGLRGYGRLDAVTGGFRQLAPTEAKAAVKGHERRLAAMAETAVRRGAGLPAEAGGAHGEPDPNRTGAYAVYRLGRVHGPRKSVLLAVSRELRDPISGGPSYLWL